MPDFKKALTEKLQLVQQLLTVRAFLMATKQQIDAALDTLQTTVDNVQQGVADLITQVQNAQTNTGLDATATDDILARLNAIQSDLQGTSTDPNVQAATSGGSSGGAGGGGGAGGQTLPPGTSTSGGMAGGTADLSGQGGTVGGT